MNRFVALVLHAHLPYVRHVEHTRSLEERWLYEAIWESYLPLVAMIQRLTEAKRASVLTLSLSPTLMAMLDDPLLRSRFEAHLERMDRLAASLEAKEPRLAFYRERFRAARATWEAAQGDLIGALIAARDAGTIELLTTAATHAYLPGLLPVRGSVRAQLRLGLRAFAARTGEPSRGLWLPECAFDPTLEGDLASAGARFTVLDAHGLDLARPAPPFGVHAPILGPRGVAFFARDPDATREVWSRSSGYPGDPLYREFYRDLGFDLAEDELLGELGPNGSRVMTGLKLHRITGRAEKEPYDPALAQRRAREHAALFVRERSAALSESPAPAPILVAPFDAELFGHWWFEGPEFLEAVLGELDGGDGRPHAITLSAYLHRFPEMVLATPAASTWGEGGFGDVWSGPTAAPLMRHVHHTARAVEAAAREHGGASGLAGHALDQAIRELLLLESSDWPFMIHRGEMTEYARARVALHQSRATRLARIAASATTAVEDVALVHRAASENRFLATLEGPDLRDGFDAWSDR